MTTSRLTRRQMFRFLCALAATGSASALVAACAPAPQAPTAAPKAAEPTKPAAAPPAAATTAPAAAPTAAPAAPKPTEAAKPAATTSARPTPLAKVRAGQSTNILTLDPAAPTNAPSAQAILLSSGQLYRFDAERKPVPDLVEKTDLSADGKTVRMTLKPNLVYSDGSPVQAADAVFSLERARKGASQSFYTPVEAAEAPDDRTIVWKLKAPYPDFLAVLSHHHLMLHPRSKVEASKDYFNKPVSAGPYVVKEWIPGTPRMLLEANPRYVGGEMMVKELELVAVADLTSRVLQLATGALDWAFDLPVAATSSLPKEVTAVPNPLGGMYHLTFNLEKQGPFQDAKVRQAVSLAVDRAAISQKAFMGMTPPAMAFLYSGAPEHEPVLPNGGKRDLEGAKKLIAESSYAKGGEVSLLTWSARAGWKEATLIIAENLKDIGITAKVDAVEDAVVVNNFRTGNYDAWWTGTVALPIFVMTTIFAPGGFYADLAKYNNPKVTELVEQARVESDLAKRKQLMTDLQKLALQDMPHVAIADRVLLTGTRLKDNIVAPVPRSDYFRVKTVAEMGR